MKPDDVAVLAKEDEEAMLYLLNKYKGLLKVKVRRYYLAGSDFDDLLQEAYWGFTKAIKDFDPSYGKSFINFAMLCVGRQITTSLTTANRKKMKPLNDSLRFEAYVDGRTYRDDGAVCTWGEVIPSSLDAEQEVVEQINDQIFSKDLIDIMSPLELSVCDLMAQGYKLSEIADILGRSCKSIDNTMQRIRHKMIKYLEHEARGEKYIPKQTGARCQRTMRLSQDPQKILEKHGLRRYH